MADQQPADAEQKTDNWAEMSDGEEHEEQTEEQKAEGEEKNHKIKPAKKKVPPAQKGTKNRDGDYVVATIDIPDSRTGMKVHLESTAENIDKLRNQARFKFLMCSSRKDQSIGRSVIHSGGQALASRDHECA